MLSLLTRLPQREPLCLMCLMATQLRLYNYYSSRLCNSLIKLIIIVIECVIVIQQRLYIECVIIVHGIIIDIECVIISS